MAKLEIYRKTITQIMQKHAQYKPSHGNIEALFIWDSITDNYLLIDTGWDETGRVHAVARASTNCRRKNLDRVRWN